MPGVLKFHFQAMSYTDVQQALLCTPPDCFWPSLSPEEEQPNKSFSIHPSMSSLYSTQTTTRFPTSNSPIYTIRRQEAQQQPNAHYNNEMTSEPLKLRCWDHNCNGRTFSSLGNYRRHLREKSGNAKTFRCEDCGRLFTRSTALNVHRQRCPAIAPILDMLSSMGFPLQVQSSAWLPLDNNLDLKALQAYRHGETCTFVNSTFRPS
jgi:Zinc finger, C2H2 type